MSDSEEKTSPPEAAFFGVHKALLDDAWLLWKKHRDAHKPIGAKVFSRLSIVTFTQIAAVTAVDVGMTEEQFLKTCEANYRGAVQRAPKWG